MLEGNLIMRGLKEDLWELEDNLKERIHKAISATVDDDHYSECIRVTRNIGIRTAKRLGKYRKDKSRPVAVCFERKQHTDILLENRSYLPKGIFVDHEYTKEAENNRSLLKPILRLAKQIPKYQGKCKLDEDTLIILGMKYTVNTIHLLPPDLSGFHASSRTSKETLDFFGELNPLSNFHLCRFAVEDKEYNSSEQFIQHQKAIHFGDSTTANRILASNSAFECQQLGKEVHGYNHENWAEAAKVLVLPGIMSKFVSNPNLAGVLVNMGNKKIVECSYDSVWGTGVPLNNKDYLKEENWADVSLLGEMLMETREELNRLNILENVIPDENITGSLQG